MAYFIYICYCVCRMVIILSVLQNFFQAGNVCRIETTPALVPALDTVKMMRIIRN